MLTLDASVQHIVERELELALEQFGAASGSVIVMDPKTGAIIAMASRPTYNSNNYQEFHIPDQDAYANPAISSLYEPGSTFKLITLAGALDAGVITPAANTSMAAAWSTAAWKLRTGTKKVTVGAI